MLSRFGGLEMLLALLSQFVPQRPVAIIRALHSYDARMVLIHGFHEQL
jgi:hypothetical protein